MLVRKKQVKYLLLILMLEHAVEFKVVHVAILDMWHMPKNKGVAMEFHSARVMCSG